MRILIVDDDPIFRRRVVTILRDDGHECREVESGQKCLEAMEIWAPDIVLLDMNLPGMSGLETCESIKRLNAEQKIHRIYTVFMTEDKPTDFTYTCMIATGSMHYVKKPKLVNEWGVFIDRIWSFVGYFQGEIDFRMQILSDETGLEGKKQILEYLTRAVEGGPVSIIFIDADGFKAVNDCYGHQAGDMILDQLAERLRLAMKKNTFLGRLQGDEFVAVLETGKKKIAVERAKQLIHITDKPFFLPDGRKVSLTLSIGVAAVKAKTSPSAALDMADKAMYRAKKSGRNRVCLADGN